MTDQAHPDVHPGDGLPVLPFATASDFAAWLSEHHDSAPGVWLKFAKKNSRVASIGFREALEVSMSFGWVDSKMKRLDERYYLLRYQPRGPRSTWGPRNQRLAEQLIAEGRMHPAGRAAVDRARADGRWTSDS